MFWGQVNRSMELHTEPTPATSNYLTLQDTQPIPAMTENIVTCEVRNEANSQVLSLQGFVTPVELFPEAT